MCKVKDMYDVSEIKNYILFLKNKCSLSITLHPVGDERLISSSELITFNIHDNSYCIYVKTFPHAQKHCVARQHKITEKCKNGSFCGSCYAGVKEYVYPISNGNDIVGFICVSGYKTQNYESYIKSVSDKFDILADNLKETYRFLRDKIPAKEEVDTLIAPLKSMLELAYIKTDGQRKKEELIDKIIRYIKRYHTQNISLDDVCREFSCSRSHISHIFKKKTGQSFREYLTFIRIEDAKALLKYSRLTVTEIAFSVGFTDSNYFSNVFKKYVGVSPREYRKNCLTL